MVHSCSLRGVSGDDPEGGAGSGVPRVRLVTVLSGGSETARRALRPVLPGAGCTCSAGNGGAGNADPRPKIAREGAPRGAASRSQGTPGRLARAPDRRVRRSNRCLASTGRLSALRPPLTGWLQVQDPGANAPRERVVLRV